MVTQISAPPPLLKSTSNGTAFEHFSVKLCLNFLTLQAGS